MPSWSTPSCSGVFLYLKLTTDPLGVGVSLVSMALILGLNAIHIAREHNVTGESDEE